MSRRTDALERQLGPLPPQDDVRARRQYMENCRLRLKEFDAGYMSWQVAIRNFTRHVKRAVREYFNQEDVEGDWHEHWDAMFGIFPIAFAAI